MPLASWPIALLATVLVEVPIVVATLRDVQAPAWGRAVIAAMAQVATHPVVWFVFPHIEGLSYGAALWLAELWAWLVEGIIFAMALPGVPLLRAIGVSAIANGASLGAGMLLRAQY